MQRCGPQTVVRVLCSQPHATSRFSASSSASSSRAHSSSKTVVCSAMAAAATDNDWQKLQITDAAAIRQVIWLLTVLCTAVCLQRAASLALLRLLLLIPSTSCSAAAAYMCCSWRQVQSGSQCSASRTKTR